jgi:hypothetical protein
MRVAMRTPRRAAAVLLVVQALVAPGTALSASRPPAPVIAAPSQYVEVVPTGGGSTTTGVARQTPPAGVEQGSSGPSSTLTAAADAVGTGVDRYVLGLGVALLLVTLWLAGVSVIRSRRLYEPNG